MRVDESAPYLVLGTCNGAQYIRAQIDSICAQTMKDWTLLIRDDGSTDATLDVVRSLALADARLSVVEHESHNLGCVENFSRLAKVALERGARYVMFADQDDVWFPGKIGQTLERMRAAERRHGSDTPILVHTDLEIIDRDGTRVHSSFMRFQRVRHEPGGALRTLLVQNFVTGCTMMVNRPLLELALPVPREALMHDWWFALCAAARGSIGFVPEATMAYRRHGANTVTVRGFWRTMNPLRTNWRHVWNEGAANHARAVLQAEALLARLNDKQCGTEKVESLIRAFVRLHGRHRTGIGRVVHGLGLGLKGQTLPRTVALYLRLLARTEPTEFI